MRAAILGFSCCGLILVAQSASGAEWLATKGAKRYTGEPALAADAYLRDATPALDLTELKLQRSKVLKGAGFVTVRYQQRHHGLPVIGGEAIVRVAQDGLPLRSVLNVARELTVSEVPSVSESDALQMAADHLGIAASYGFRTLLAVRPDSSGGVLVWQVDVPSGDGGHRVVIDAHRGVVLQARPLAVHAQGRVYPISSVVTPATTDVELLDLDPATPQQLNGWSGNLAVTNYVSGGSMSSIVVEQTLLPSAGSDFLYDPPADPKDETDAFAQVGIYYHLTRMREFFTSTLGLDMSPASWRLVAVANLLEEGAPVDNAYFSPMGPAAPWDAPNMVGIGQGMSFDFAQDSDVFNHELTHYVSYNAIDFNASQYYADEYGISPFSGAIDEGLSDYFACTVNDDSTLGEASLALLGSARELTDTSKVCPDDVFGEVHLDGEIIGSLTWTIRTALGAAVADQLVWGAATLLPYGANLGDFSTALLATADDMVTQNQMTTAQRVQLEDAIRARGLDECGREIPLRVGEPRKTNMFGLDLIGQFLGGDCAAAKNFGVSLHSYFHFEVTPGADDQGVRLSAQMTPMGNGELSWGIYAKKDSHVTFMSMGFIPVVDAYDYAVEGLTGTSGELVIDANSNPPFDPTATYHAVVVHQNCPFVEVELSTEPMAPDPGPGSGGAGGGGEGGGDVQGPITVDNGCGCRLAGSSPSVPAAGWWAFALAALGWSARRRRRG